MSCHFVCWWGLPAERKQGDGVRSGAANTWFHVWAPQLRRHQGTSEQCPGSCAVLAAPHLAAQPASLGHHPAGCPFLQAAINWIISFIIITPGQARWGLDLLGLVEGVPTHGRGWNKMIFMFFPTQVVLWSSFSHSGRGIYQWIEQTFLFQAWCT